MFFKGLYLILALAILSFPIWLMPNSVAFKAFGSDQVLQLLTSLLVVSLFVERALEVFITAWRGPDLAKLNSDLAARRMEVKGLTELLG